MRKNKFCKNGHEVFGTNAILVYNDVNGCSYELCRLCREEVVKRSRKTRIEKRIKFLQERIKRDFKNLRKLGASDVD